MNFYWELPYGDTGVGTSFSNRECSTDAPAGIYLEGADTLTAHGHTVSSLPILSAIMLFLTCQASRQGKHTSSQFGSEYMRSSSFKQIPRLFQSLPKSL
jgi:hypothetical protein